MERCPKCGYERQLDNGECNPSSECPQCGIVYVKYEAYLSRMQAEQKKAERMAEEQASIQPPFEGQRDIQSKFRIKAFLRDLLKKHLQGEKLSWFLSIIRNSPPVQWLDKIRIELPCCFLLYGF